MAVAAWAVALPSGDQADSSRLHRSAGTVPGRRSTVDRSVGNDDEDQVSTRLAPDIRHAELYYGKWQSRMQMD